MKTSKNPAEQRKFIRLTSVFPVEYLMPDSDDTEDFWQQGFTCNVSKGGLCLAVNHLDSRLIAAPSAGQVVLKVKISMPLFKPPVQAQAQVVWIEKIREGMPARYHIGLQFLDVAPKDLARLVHFARWDRFALKAARLAAILFFLAFSLSALYNFQLHARNKRLVDRLVSTQREETQVEGTLQSIDQEKAALLRKIDFSSREMAELNRQMEAAQKEIDEQSEQEGIVKERAETYSQKIEELNKQIANLKKEREPLENQYALLVSQEDAMNDRLALLEQEKTGLRESVVEQMIQWLRSHQSPTTGLVLSFEGNVGIINHWAFTYDQALAINTFLLSGDIDAARKIINFFSRTMPADFKGFHNGYYFDSGDIAEYTVHCGPNLWLGMAIMQYTAQTGDRQYLPMAENIAKWLTKIQDQDPAGGLRGGPDVTWFATEHNLDAYAFFTMLDQLTDKPEYDLSRKKVLSWLRTYAMTPHGADYKSPPVNRGRGDATIATDTFAWSLAALGPHTLVEIGMDPEKIMDFAEEHCAVTVPFVRPSGISVEVSGFDFAKYTHMPRGGLISPEWTSQMIISYQMLSQYLDEKKETNRAKYYRQKARAYLNELNKLIISSPSPTGQGKGCLPYATLENADTGHGWRTPFGNQTGSVAGTAYMIMAVKEFNPLMLEKRYEE